MKDDSLTLLGLLVKPQKLLTLMYLGINDAWTHSLFHWRTHALEADQHEGNVKPLLSKLSVSTGNLLPAPFCQAFVLSLEITHVMLQNVTHFDFTFIQRNQVSKEIEKEDSVQRSR